ncbi:cyclopropane-fatty-acyl-phospholipid synthase family protein [Thiotrichales bacterium 19S3-7]|nr:cyclopropane-fatty-acyl-phospholipid synthase family protein [Thiotrichales bacterium 19S3-7]MCF6800640.1 cyclopropane-fatty-acyl-phospholipid synthase family protein [Thiotrichales bacterium 19S3-11]
MFEKMIKNKLLSSLDKTQYGEIHLQTPEGGIYHFKGKKPGQSCDIILEDWRTIANLNFKGDIGLAEDYRDGYIHTNDLTKLLLFGLENEAIFSGYIRGNFFYQQLSKLSYLAKRNTIQGSRKNIYKHYDLGNQFYKLWLDETMTYSSAIFNSQNDTLTDAQINKYDRILEKIPNDGKLLEIGCGWGGFLERALSKKNTKNKGITISEAQCLYANQRLGNAASIKLEDYRVQKGQYDVIVSIEMLEAVGQAYWPVYFRKLKELLKPNATAIIQSIVIDDALFKSYTKGADMIRTFIFPGGMLPSSSVIKGQLKQTKLKLTDQYSFGQDYAKTLYCWLEKFKSQDKSLISMGFDKRFQRLWQFYLSYCIAGFQSRRTDVLQWEIAHA